ncbi:hypothetical protein B0H12DRAFT_1287911 [Mycena haematopus]|nr:hypothetical protein B0H12DRAFT_1287911 [Mycena haematopus]
MFSGEPATAESQGVTPNTFIKKFRAHMRDLGGGTALTDAQKIDAFPDYLVEDSPAEKWFVALQGGATPVTTWATLEAAFHVRFPGPEKVERTAQEWEQELAGMRLTLNELTTTVKVSGAEVFAHVHFASCLLELAQLAGIAATPSGIWQSRDALPEVLREKVPSMQADWTSYTAAIRLVDRVYLRESVAKARKTQEFERTVTDLRSRQAPLTPVSKMAAQLSRAALATPRTASMPTRTNVPANAGAGVDVFGAGGGQGNMFTPPEMTNEGRTQLRKIVERLTASMLPDSAAGREEYGRRVANWNTIHGGKKVLLERTGYPLSPGTVPPLSGECYGCGKVTIPWHRRTECQGPALPLKESTFRSLCAKYLREARAVGVNAVLGEQEDLDWMDFMSLSEDAEQDFGAGLSE